MELVRVVAARGPMAVCHPAHMVEGVLHGIAAAQVEERCVGEQGNVEVHPCLQCHMAAELTMRQVQAAGEACRIEGIGRAVHAAQGEATRAALSPCTAIQLQELPFGGAECRGAGQGGGAHGKRVGAHAVQVDVKPHQGQRSDHDGKFHGHGLEAHGVKEKADRTPVPV